MLVRGDPRARDRRGAARRAWSSGPADRRAQLHVAGVRSTDRCGIPGGPAMKPVLFVTGHVPASRRGAFEALGQRLPLTLALFGGRHQHGAPPGPPPAGVDVREVRQREIRRLVASGEYGAVIVGTGRPRRAANRVARGAAQRRAVHLLGGALAHADNPGASRRPGADAPHLSTRRRCGHIRTTRQCVRRGARRGADLRRAPGSRQRLLGGAHGSVPRRALRRAVRRARGPGEGRGGGRRGLAASRVRSRRGRARARRPPRRRSARHQRDFGPRRTRTAQPLRSRARSGHGFRKNTQVRRAVGAWL